MGGHAGPNIVTDGLILCLDAGNTQSYPGTGTTWYDISGYGRDATITGADIFTTTDGGGKFDYRGVSQTTKWISLPASALQATAGYHTLLTWMQPEDDLERSFHSMSDGTDHDLCVIDIYNNTLYSYEGGSSISFTDDEWMQITFTRPNSNSGSLYKNIDTPVASTLNDVSDVVSTGWILNQEQDSLAGGFDSTQNTYAAFSVILLYDKVLTAAEIEQNFNAYKGRFGI